MVSSVGLCRYGGRIDCCWGWVRRPWGQCQREYRPRAFSSPEVGSPPARPGGVVLTWRFQVPLTPYSAPFQPEPPAGRVSLESHRDPPGMLILAFVPSISSSCFSHQAPSFGSGF